MYQLCRVMSSALFKRNSLDGSFFNKKSIPFDFVITMSVFNAKSVYHDQTRY